MEQGLWQGILYSDIKKKWGDLYRQLYEAPFETTPPGGETMAMIARRVFAALDDIARFHPDSQIVIVSHEIPLALIRCAAYGNSLHDMWTFAPHNCQPSRVLWPLNHPVEIPDPGTAAAA
jgi:probable phosphoglycerate mutase